MSGTDILREVDESLRVEKAIRFWKDHGNTVLILIVAIILGTAAQAGWTSYKKHQDEKSTTAFLEAIKEKDSISALKKLSADGQGSGSALAGLQLASMSLGKKDWPTAIAAYKQVSENKSAPQMYRDLALAQWVSLQIDHDEKAKGEDLLKALAPLIADEKSTWHAQAILTSALVKAEKNNDIAAARVDLQLLLAKENLPASFLSQVKALDEVYKTKLDGKK